MGSKEKVFDDYIFEFQVICLMFFLNADVIMSLSCLVQFFCAVSALIRRELTKLCSRDEF